MIHGEFLHLEPLEGLVNYLHHSLQVLKNQILRHLPDVGLAFSAGEDFLCGVFCQKASWFHGDSKEKLHAGLACGVLMLMQIWARQEDFVCVRRLSEPLSELAEGRRKLQFPGHFMTRKAGERSLRLWQGMAAAQYGKKVASYFLGLCTIFSRTFI